MFQQVSQFLKEKTIPHVSRIYNNSKYSTSFTMDLDNYFGDFKDEYKVEMKEEEACTTPEAMFHKELEILMQNNPKSFHFYNKSIGRREMLGVEIHHEECLGHNLQSTQNSPVTSSYKSFPFKSGLPIPINVIKDEFRGDPAMRSLLAKMKWKKSISSMAKNISGVDRKVEKIFNYEDTIYSMPQYMVEFMQLFESDPDPYQDSKYDWYCSGSGNLQQFNINGTSYVIQAVGNQIDITPIQHLGHKISMSTENKQCIDLFIHLFIYELCIYQTNSTELLLAIRTRCVIYIFKISSRKTGKLLTKKIKTFSSQVPVSSIAFIDKSKIICSYVDNTVHLNSLICDNSDKIKLSVDFGCDTNNWISVNGINDNSYLISDRKRISILDERIHDATVAINDVTDACESISLVRKSVVNEFGYYVGTYHRLFMTDVRYCSPFRMIQRWTHGMQTAPLFAQSQRFSDGEIVCIANHVSSDVRLIVDSANASFMPWKPKTALDSLKYAQIRGRCIDPNLSLKERVNISINGLALINNDIVMQNSYGDLFHNHLTFKGLMGDDDVPGILERWAKTLLRYRSKKAISVSSKTSISKYINNKLTKLPVYDVDTSDNDIWNDADEVRLDDDLNLKGLLESELLSAWNVEPEVP